MTEQDINESARCLKMLHFNDVYDIEENKSKAGATEDEENKQIKAGAS